MNELFSLAVALFKLSANYSEPKMSQCRLDGTRSVRDKQTVKVSRPRLLGSRKCKAAVLPEEVESVPDQDEFARTCGEAEPCVQSGGGATDLSLPQLESGSAELSDDSGGHKGKFNWLLKRDRVLWHSDQVNYFGDAVSERGEDLDSPSFRTALESCACMATFEESLESLSLDIEDRTSAASFRRSIRVSAPQLCRDSVEECLVQCRSRSSRSCQMDPLDGVVFHRFMVNSRGDLFDYDLQTAHEGAPIEARSRQEFPGASGLRNNRNKCALKLPVNASAPGQEDSVQHWRGQAEALREECDLLQMERELAVNRWKQGCQEMDQALQTVHTLRMAVDSLMGDKLRGNSKRRPSQPVNGERQSKPRVSKSGDLPRLIRQADVLEGRPAKNRKGKTKASDPPTCRLAVEEAQQFESDNQLENASEAPRRSVKFAFKMDVASSIDKLMEVSGRGFAGESGSSCEMDALGVEGRDGHNSAQSDPPNVKLHEERDSSRLCTSDQEPSTREPRQHAIQQAECGLSDQERRAEERAMTAIRNILKQFHQENEQWSQVQEILHHVSEDMRNLSESCAEWEERALRAETLSNTLQTKVSLSQSRAQTAEQRVCELESCLDSMRASATQHAVWESRATLAEQRVSELESTLLDLRATADRADEWKSRTEIAEQKVRDLESGMSHLRATVEQVKGRHAIEQSRLLEAGTRLRQTGGLRQASNDVSPKSRKTPTSKEELQSPRPINITSRLSPPSVDPSRYKCDAGTDRKVAPMGFSRHRRTAGLYKDLDTVELSQYLSEATGDHEGGECSASGTESRAKTLETSEWQKLDGSTDTSHSGPIKLQHPDNLVGRIKTSSSKDSLSKYGSARAMEIDGNVSAMGKVRCPPRPTISPKTAKRADAVMSYSGPMRQSGDPSLMSVADADSPYKRFHDRGSQMTRSRRVSRERLRHLNSQRSERNKRKDRRFGGGSWDVDEDRSDIASVEPSSDSESAFESAEEDCNSWTVNVVDDWPESGTKELSNIRRKYQLPTEQQVQQRVSSAGSKNTDATQWKHQLPGRKISDGTATKIAEIRPEDLKVKRHLSAEKVKTAIPTFQSLFPGKLRRKTAVKNADQKGRTMGEDLTGDARGLPSGIADSGAPQKLQGQRDSSVQKSRVSFLNGIQKQFLVRNSPGHMKVPSPQLTPDRSYENSARPSSTQYMERKPWKEKKSESSFLEDIRRHLIGRSPLHPGKDRSSRAISPFAGDHRMHSLMSSPVGSRPPLIELAGNGSEFLGTRAFYSG